MRNELRQVIRLFREVLATEPSDAQGASDMSLAAYCLKEHMSFRLPGGASTDPWIGFRCWFRATKRLKSSQVCLQHSLQKTGIALLNSSFANEKLVVDYIERSSGQSVEVYIAKDFCGSHPTGRKGSWRTLFAFALIQSIRCIGSGKRANHAQTILEVVEHAWLLRYFKEHNIHHVYDFIPYEKDGNTLTLLLRKADIRVTKVPSSGPLATHNRILIGDEIIFSGAYHYEEKAFFGETIRSQLISFWPPERAFTYIHHYVLRPQPPEGTIGYYSHGEWIRRAQGHAEHGLDVLQTEDQILRDLARYLKSNPDRKLIVFPHPRERHSNWIDQTYAHYQSYLGEIPFHFAPSDVLTPHAFHLVDIAVVSYSSIIFERLFCGYKIILGNHTIPGFPIAGSPLSSICFKSFDKMEQMLDQSFPISADQFYEINGLVGYRYFDHPELKGISHSSE